MAAIYDSRAVAELLLDRGADYEAMDEEQRTPWDLALKNMKDALPQLRLQFFLVSSKE